jgi:uncharacterized membrane protein YidH (DUF202 family)
MLLRTSVFAVEGVVLASFGVALATYARSLPPTVPLGSSMPAYLVSRLAAFSLGVALLHLGVLTGISGLHHWRRQTSSFVQCFSGVVMIVVAAMVLVLTLLFSFPQY